jgi:hypothetical protein
MGFINYPNGVGVFLKRNTETSWFLPTGISAANCIAAYAAKGAANLVASYINLANPGTYDAAPGVAPAWDVTNGWDFSSNKYLTCGIIPTNTSWSAIVRFSGADYNQCLFGAYSNINISFLIQPHRQYGNGGLLLITGLITSGVAGFAGNIAYLNGNAETGTIAAGTIPAFAVSIGCLNYLNGTQIQNTKYIQALAFYNIPLSAPQMLAVTNAMNLI